MTDDVEVFAPQTKSIVRTLKAMSAEFIYEQILEEEFAEPAARGCNRDCPCRLSINCRIYHNLMDYTRFRENRGSDEEILEKIWEYYNTFFKMRFEMSESIANG